MAFKQFSWREIVQLGQSVLQFFNGVLLRDQSVSSEIDYFKWLLWIHVFMTIVVQERIIRMKFRMC
uniref:Uncharacterized protein n=1 Tax=Helianthus annuus TaxID=4232 RepID=A0A251TB37_HELAN